METINSSEPNHKLELMTAFGMSEDDAFKLSSEAISQASMGGPGAKAGCALLTSKGTVFSAHLMQDTASGKAAFAEDLAIDQAIAAGETEFKAICSCYVNADGIKVFSWPKGTWRNCF